MTDQQPATIYGDRYQIVKHIARGGMAQVYLAQDRLLDRPVALKSLFPELSVDQNFVERFRREAKAAANLSHPNIVSVYDWGQGENTYYIVMEYVDGPTVSALLRQGPLPPERAASIAASVAAALDFAHRRGVIHRDVKPGNVLIDDRSNVKVADFGIARAAGTTEGDLTQTGSVMGTATYFSPEQAQGYPVDARSDVYSLGVVLYEMVAGRPPFSGDTPVSIAYQHVKEPPPLPSSVNPDVPPALESVIMKALNKDPKARYPSAEEFRADLARFIRGEPVLAAATATTVMAPVEPTRVAALAGAAPIPPTAVVTRTAIPPEDRNRTGLYALIAFIILLLLLGGYLGGRQAGLFGSSTKNLTIPTDIVGKPQSAAQNELSQDGFTNVKVTDQQSSSVAQGLVITTSPNPGSTVRANDPVNLVVSAGPTTVKVPDVTNQPVAQADATLSAAGFKPNNTTANSNTVPQGNVISTSPAAGATAPQGSAITVTVSSGKQTVTIPELRGSDPAAAGDQLGAMQLQTQTAQEYSTSVASGLVTRTDPPAGTSVPVGSTVTVFVSEGPPPTTTTAPPPTTTTIPDVTVPDLSGDTQTQAQQALQSAGLVGQYTQQPVTDPSQNGKVVSQTPAPGSSVPSGSTVQVVVGQATTSAG